MTNKTRSILRITLIIIILMLLLSGAIAMFGRSFGWIGILGVTAIFIAICFFEFYRSMKLVNVIGTAPEGYTLNADFLYTRIQPGMSLIKAVQTAQALGKKIGTQPDRFCWEDENQRLTVTVEDKKVVQVELETIEKKTTPNQPEPIEKI